MSVVNAIPLIAAGDDGYSISRSLRFRSSASAYLNRTPASAGNRKTWTWSAWVKRGAIASVSEALFGTDNSNNIRFSNADSSQKLVVENYNGAGADYYVFSTAVYRDPSAWYHIVVVWDSGNATAANRQLVYVNGSLLTAIATGNAIPLNATSIINSATAHNIGRTTNASYYFDGYLAEVNFIDGQALTPSSFGEFSLYNQWLPKKYAGTYGTNGFYLPFTNNASAATLGNDFSGNSNTWTTNNISVTTGSSYDSTTDVPTLTSATAANFAVISPLWPASYSNGSITNGNLTALITAVSSKNCFASMPLPTSGKIYYELTSTYSGSGMIVGVTATPSGNDPATAGSNVYGYYNANGNKYNNGTGTAYGTAWYTSGQTYTIGVAYDADAGTLVFYLNNTSQGTAFTLTTGVSYFPTAGNVSGSGNNTINWNFGQRPFTYTPPTGYLALNTFNL